MGIVWVRGGLPHGLSDISVDLVYGSAVSDKNVSDVMVWIKAKGKTRNNSEQIIYTTIYDNKSLLFTIETRDLTKQKEEFADNIIKTSEYHLR